MFLYMFCSIRLLGINFEISFPTILHFSDLSFFMENGTTLKAVKVNLYRSSFHFYYIETSTIFFKMQLAFDTTATIWFAYILNIMHSHRTNYFATA
ncbi:hypothetical protein ACJX0J_034747, partial [Zea mays]